MRGDRPMVRAVCLGAVALLMTTLTLRAAGAEVECRWTDGAPVIDGDLGDEAWRSATWITHFRQTWMAPPGQRDGRTRAALRWDAEYLYFAAEMSDDDLFADITQHDGFTWHNDVFELFFQPRPDGGEENYYEFQVTANNTVLDMFIPKKVDKAFFKYHKADAFHLTTAVKRRGTLNVRDDKDAGWTVEGRIPWRDFIRTGGRPAAGDTWRFTLCRYDYAKDREPLLTATAPLKELNFHRVIDYETLRFVGADAPPSRIATEQRWTTSMLKGTPEPPPPYRAVRAFGDLPLKQPVYVVRQPASTKLIVLENYGYGDGRGSIRRFDAAAKTPAVETLLELSEMPYGLTFHPRFAVNGYVYLGCNGKGEDGKPYTRVVRYTMRGDGAGGIDAASRKVIIEWPSGGHNGGDLAFGGDGMLFISSGDGTSDSDEDRVGQDLSVLRAKVLRIDVDGGDEKRPYGVPADNPFVNTPGVRPETWAYGLRNPWRMSYDAASDQLWVGENGQDLWEYARLVRRGENYGWSAYEGNHPFYLDRLRGPAPVTPPTIEHSHAEFRSLTGGVVYRGRMLPELDGVYVYGDYSTGRIWGAKHDGTMLTYHRELTDSPLAITGFGLDHEGEMLVVDYGGGLYRLERTPAEAMKPADFPRRLSETGLFEDTATLRLATGVMAYSVKAAAWFDGAAAERWVATPPGARVEFNRRGGWKHPNGAAYVQTLSLEREIGNPATSRRIETRVLLKQEDDWAGYTYVWREDQSDADLAAAGGEEKTLNLREGGSGSERAQKWRVPSRAECLVCHSRAAGFVLSMSDAQLDGVHDYGGWTENQLSALQRAGVLRDTSGRGAAKPTVTLVDPVDGKQALEQRVRSYLAVNCAHCHQRAGGGNSAFDVRLQMKLEETKLIDALPLHGSFGLPDARLVSPGQPGSSVLLMRVLSRGPGQMPPLGTTRPDPLAMQLLAEWIATMKR